MIFDQFSQSSTQAYPTLGHSLVDEELQYFQQWILCLSELLLWTVEWSVRSKDIAKTKFRENDITGAKKFALKAKALFETLEGIDQMIVALDVHVRAQTKIAGENDWYGILEVPPMADEEAIRKKYKKLAFQTHHLKCHNWHAVFVAAEVRPPSVQIYTVVHFLTLCYALRNLHSFKGLLHIKVVIHKIGMVDH